MRREKEAQEHVLERHVGKHSFFDILKYTLASNWKICGPQEAIIKGGSYTKEKNTLGGHGTTGGTQLHTYIFLLSF